MSEKIFALHHFLTPKNCILEAIESKCLYISIYVLKKGFFQRRSKVLFGGGWNGGRLNNFLKAAHCLGLAKCFACFAIFILIEIFENLSIF